MVFLRPEAGVRNVKFSRAAKRLEHERIVRRHVPASLKYCLWAATPVPTPTLPECTAFCATRIPSTQRSAHVRATPCPATPPIVGSVDGNAPQPGHSVAVPTRKRNEQGHWEFSRSHCEGAQCEPMARPASSRDAYARLQLFGLRRKSVPMRSRHNSAGYIFCNLRCNNPLYPKSPQPPVADRQPIHLTAPVPREGNRSA